MSHRSFWQRACLEQMSRLRGQFFGMIKFTVVSLYKKKKCQVRRTKELFYYVYQVHTNISYIQNEGKSVAR